jgi:hypothetical protein
MRRARRRELLRRQRQPRAGLGHHGGIVHGPKPHELQDEGRRRAERGAGGARERAVGAEHGVRDACAELAGAWRDGDGREGVVIVVVGGGGDGGVLGRRRAGGGGSGAPAAGRAHGGARRRRPCGCRAAAPRDQRLRYGADRGSGGPTGGGRCRGAAGGRGGRAGRCPTAVGPRSGPRTRGLKGTLVCESRRERRGTPWPAGPLFDRVIDSASAPPGRGPPACPCPVARRSGVAARCSARRGAGSAGRRQVGAAQPPLRLCRTARHPRQDPRRRSGSRTVVQWASHPPGGSIQAGRGGGKGCRPQRPPARGPMMAPAHPGGGRALASARAASRRAAAAPAAHGAPPMHLAHKTRSRSPSRPHPTPNTRGPALPRHRRLARPRPSQPRGKSAQ